MIKNFKNLQIWQRSRTYVKMIYETTYEFPKVEKFGLISQMNRAVVSIPSNIAEGCGRGTLKNLSYFLDISIGSACELETQIYLSHDLGFIDVQKMKLLSDEINQIRRMIIGYQKTLVKR